jgi:Kef-type K+ transport system membrane component KefB
MSFLLNETISLPLTDPVVIFSVVLLIIFFVPMILNLTRVPAIIGMIVVGAIVGPHGFNLLLRDNSIQLFGKVGLLYIMFLAALEVDLEDFKNNRVKSSVFGLFTFSIPMLMAIPVVFYILGYPVLSTILIASIFSSHTLISYPLIDKYEITRNRAVNITVGGTMLTDILALLVLAVIVQVASGAISAGFWIRLAIGMGLFILLIWQVIPRIASFFFKQVEDSIQQYIFVLGIVFLCAFLAEIVGMEAIIGAFLGGLTMNKFIPKTSALMNRILFIGNALFIPFFLIGVGMLVDYRSFINNPRTILVAGIITALALGTKYIAALLTGKTFSLSKPETQLMFGLSSAQAAATLAVVTVGYNVLMLVPGGGTARLLDEAILNGSILMILITCTISSLTVNKNARIIAQAEVQPGVDKTSGIKEKIMILLSQPEMIKEILELALLIKQSDKKNNMFALNMVVEQSDQKASEKEIEEGKKLLDKVVREAAGSDHEIEPIVRYDQSVATGVIHSMREKDITCLLIGIDAGGYPYNGKIKPFITEIVHKTNESVLAYRPLQPLATLKCLIVLVPEAADQESGFRTWFDQIRHLHRQSGSKIIFRAPPSVLEKLRAFSEKQKEDTQDEKDQEPSDGLTAEYEPFDTPEDHFQDIAGKLNENDMLVLIGARRGTSSYQGLPEPTAQVLSSLRNSYLVIYPEQGDYNPLNYFDLFHPSKRRKFKSFWKRS